MAEALLAGRVVGGPASARIAIDGSQFINFHGSGYLALSGVPEIRTAVQRALASGVPFAQHVGTRLGGIDPIFESVEREAAMACGTEASVYFASGYLIGTVGLAGLEDPFDAVFLDEHAHYCLKDAVRLSGRPWFTFAHCDVQSLAEALKRHVDASQRPLVVTDGVFASSGRVPPLAEYAGLLASYDGRMLVDEAHAFGVLGENGRGAVELCGVGKIATSGATLSKAYCAQGAFIGCAAETAVRLRESPPVRGSTAGSPLSAAAAAASLAYVSTRPELRHTLRAMGDYLRGRLRGIGFDIVDSPAPIVSFRVGSAEEMLKMQRRMFERGILIYHSRYVGAGPEGLIRCAVFRDHTRDDIDALVTAL